MANIARVVSPIDGAVYAEHALMATAEALDAVRQAAVAQKAWQQKPLAQRIAILAEATERLELEADAVVEELAHSMGRPVALGGGEIRGFRERSDYMLGVAPTALADTVPSPQPGFERFIRREPVGTVLAIAPWNYPYMSAVNIVWPALAAGNAVFLKHAQQTVMAGARIERILKAAGLPENVFRAVPMSHETTAAVVQAEPVRMICFTGSVRGGRAIQQAVGGASGFPGTGLELGGKDPAYVRPDADLDMAAAGIADGILSNAGQSCCSIERVYVDEAVYDDFMVRLEKEARAFCLGNPLEAETTLGPLVSVKAADFVREQVAEALAAGAHNLIDPALYPAEGGAYLAPRILVDADHSMRLMTEESFGPVAGVMKVRSDDEAVALMNDSEYGLTASIWTDDVDVARTLGDRIETGTVFMNRCDYLDPALAWTGVKSTGRGHSMSAAGYDSLTRPKSYHLKIA